VDDVRQPSRDEIELARRRSEQLARLARRLIGAATTESLALAVVELGAQAIDADYTNLGVVDLERGVLDLVHPPTTPREIVERFGVISLELRTPTTEAIRRADVVVVPNNIERARDYPETTSAAVDNGLETTVHIPLLDGVGAVIGTFAAGWSSETRIDESLRTLLDTVADLCALTLQRTRRSDAQVELVEALHNELLPVTPSVPALQIALRYVPANDEVGIGGDWYDVLRLDQDRTAIVVGDVVGHGVQAAARMTQVRSYVNSLVRLEVPLRDLFPEAERLLLTGGMDYLATLCVHIIDSAEGTLTCLSAGHPPSVVSVGDEGVVVLPLSGQPPLGVGSTDHEPLVLSFGPTDVLLAFTDGLVERRGESLDDGIRRAGDALFRSRHADVEVIADAVLEASLAPTVRRDDVALAVVRRV
jgi:hypothetical protein